MDAIHDGRPRGRARPTGRNFAAGMSGGIAYVLDPEGEFGAPRQSRDGGPRGACSERMSPSSREIIERHVALHGQRLGARDPCSTGARCARSS